MEVARRLRTEIISADSMQVYRHLSIGTAKPAAQELHRIPYHLIDYVPPDAQYNLGWFLRDAEPLISRLRESGRLPIICGGTGLYLRGLLYGVFEDGRPDQETREQLEERLRDEGLPALYAEMMRLDPRLTHILPKDRQRILRALEVIHTTGTPLSQLQTQIEAEPRYNALLYVLERPREELYHRINARVDAMLELGLLEEVRAYLQAGYSPGNPAINALGYTELIRHVRGELPLGIALASMKQKSRNYAKRQLTWFRSMKGAQSLNISGRSATDVAGQIANTVA